MLSQANPNANPDANVNSNAKASNYSHFSSILNNLNPRFRICRQIKKYYSKH